ncbi:MAG: peptide MFS transporter [Brumimicrobium sp.]|nr:peptide MFS transporter [Brumimicrobium sp.]
MSNETQKQGHPKGLYSLFFTEMWERFSYYGMRALLTIFLTAELATGGFGLDRAESLQVYGIFTALVYLTPILGGWFSDNVLGQRKSILIGGITMAIGQFMLAFSSSAQFISNLDDQKFFFYMGLGVLILGNGFFKPNISTIVGNLYENDDPRKDGGFTIFYMGINIGAFLSPFIAGTLGEKFGWPYGYLSAGIGMLIGVIWFHARRSTLNDLGLPPKAYKENRTDLITKDWMDIIIYSIVNVAIVIATMIFWSKTGDIVHEIVIWAALIGGIGFLGKSIASGTSGKTEWSRVMVILILAFFNIVFWAGFEQAGGTFNLFAQENTDRVVFGFEIPTTWFQNVNPIAIVTLAPLFSILWVQLAKRKLNPRTPIKFAIAMFIGAISFYIMTLATKSAEGGNLVSPMWLVVVYVLLTCGELMLSPIGLSMVTKLAPQKTVSIMMGIWMASFALGNYLAATLEQILVKYDFDLYTFITYLMIASGAGLLILSRFLNKSMKGIH